MQQFHFLLTTGLPALILIGIILVLGGVTSFFYFIVKDVRRKGQQKKQIEMIEVNHTNSILRAKLEIQEQTFRDISADIHDNVGQKLTLVKLNLIAARRNGFTELESSETIISETLDDLRNLSRSLSAEKIRTQGFVACIREDLERLQKDKLINVEFKIYNDYPLVREDEEIILFRIYQEAIQNVLRHANAQRVFIILEFTEGSIRMSVSDNGKGFSNDRPTGQGLKNMELRTQALGGTMEIKTNENGTTLLIVIPVKNGKD